MALVLAAHRDLELVGVIEGVPAGEHVEHGEDQRNHGEPEKHDHGDDVLAGRPQVMVQDFADLAH